jgi:8-oxo-dGTP diphosphatase / 2-hydroxy-dATP diphosphatase
MNRILTLSIPLRGDEVLLGMKKRGFGAGRWNGFGGKVEDESIKEAAIRELFEEVSLTTTVVEEIGILAFSFEKDPVTLETHVFRVLEFEGEPTETDEMSPKWWRRDQIPYGSMWPDDVYWFPYLLNNRLFRGSFHFDKPSSADYTSNILSQSLEEVPAL